MENTIIAASTVIVIHEIIIITTTTIIIIIVMIKRFDIDGIYAATTNIIRPVDVQYTVIKLKLVND